MIRLTDVVKVFGALVAYGSAIGLLVYGFADYLRYLGLWGFWL